MVEAGHPKIHRSWKKEIVSKVLYIFFFFLKWSISELLVARDLLSDLFLYWLVVIMTGDITKKDLRYQAILHLIPRITPMGLRIQGPSYIKVSDVVIKGQQLQGWVFGCGDNNCEICQGFHTLLCILKH